MYLRLFVVYVTLLVMTIFSVYAHGYERSHDCSKHPIYCQITNNNPTINRPYAFRLSNIIYKATLRHKIDPVIFTAILAQESMYDLKATNCTTGIIEQPEHIEVITMASMLKCKADTNKTIGDAEFHECLKDKPTEGRVSVCTDFGIGQIWYKTAQSYEFDIEKLTSDLEYSVEAAAIVLKDFQSRYAHKEKDWWTRYNARSTKARNKYKRLVEIYTDAD